MSVSPVRSSSPAAVPQDSGNNYTVQRGDTLSSIAARHGVSLSALEAANPQIKNPNLIYPGQTIHIPGGGGSHGTSGASGTAGAGPTGATPSTLQGRENEAVGYFMSQGWTRAQAAGIVANLEVESAHTLDPHIQQFGGGPGYGIAQWEGPRQAQFAQVFGHDIHSATYGEELQFVQWELTHTESGAGSALRQTTNAYDAGMSVLNNYERPADRNQPQRGQLAQQIYDRATPTNGGPGPAPKPTPTPSPKPSPQPSGGDYTVQRGDTMASIASRHGVSLSALEAANPQIHNPNLIYPGEKVHLPGGSHSSGSATHNYTVQRGDTMAGIASRNHVSLSALESANPQIHNPNLIYPGQTIHIPGSSGGSQPAPKPASHNYTVQSGDTMSSIASRNGVSLSTLENANPQISNPNRIYVGQVIHIPGAGGSSGPGPVHGGGPVKGTNAAAIAKNYLGEYETQLQRDGVTLHCDTSESCANFVTSMLIKAGQVPANGMSYVQRVNVGSMSSYLQAHGWHVVPASQAKAGDVWVVNNSSEQHTELVASNDNGHVTLIGSNNHPVNSNQQINYDGYSASIGGSYILAPP